jgi:hypothetical protein
MEGLNHPFFTHAAQNVVWIIRIVFKPDVTEFKMRYVIKKNQIFKSILLHFLLKFNKKNITFETQIICSLIGYYNSVLLTWDCVTWTGTNYLFYYLTIIYNACTFWVQSVF